LSLENRAGFPTSVTFAVQADSTGDGWQISYPAALKVAHNETKSLDILLYTLSDQDPPAYSKLSINALAAEGPARGLLTITVASTVAVSEKNPTLYPHVGVLREGAFGTRDLRRWMNPLREDPDGGLDKEPLPGIQDPTNPDRVWTIDFSLNESLPRELRLDATQTLAARVALVAQVPFSATVRVEIGDDRKTILAGAATVVVGTQATLTDVPLVANQNTVPAASILTARVRVSSQDPAFQANAYNGLRILPYLTEFPLAMVSAGEGSLGPRLRLTLVKDYQLWVNPDESRTVPLLIENLGASNDSISFKTDSDNAGWKVSVKPSPRFKLPSRDALRVDLLATAPAEAAEGETMNLQVRVVSEIFEDESTQLEIAFVSTALSDYPDDSVNYVPDQRAAENALTPSKKTPGLPLVSIVTLLGALVSLRSLDRRMKGSV
jgi:hypothetical protein